MLKIDKATEKEQHERYKENVEKARNLELESDKEIEDLKTNKKRETKGTVFITLQTKEMASRVLLYGKDNKKSCLQRICCGKNIKKYVSPQRSNYVFVQRAPSPNDIIWDNLSVKNLEIVWRYIVVLFVTFIIIGASFGAILGLKVWQDKVRGSDIDESTWGVRIFSVFVSLVILVINEVLAWAIQWVTKHEKHMTHTIMNNSLIFKIVLSQFCNTCLVIVAINRIINKDNYYKIDIKGKTC